MSVDTGQLATTIWPLSYGQQSLWYTHQLAPDSSAYNTAFVARICSPVDVPALRETWQILLDRHAALRTTFSVRGGTPIQVVHESQEIDFAQLDSSAWSDAELNQRVRQSHCRPFDLEQGPLCRVRLFTRDSENHVLLFTAHHIATDAWSQWRLLRELRQIYPALHARQPVELKPPATSYGEFAQLQSEMLEAKGDRLWSYWRDQLAGELPLLNLPTDRPRPSVQTFNGAAEAVRLPAELSQRLRGFAEESGTTLYATLLAAFQVLLHRYSRQDDILVGSPTAGRTRTEFAGTVGDFVDMLVLRSDLSGNPSFRTFLEQVRQTVFQGLMHQDFPFRLLVERLQPRREASAPALFQAAFVWDKPPAELAGALLAGADGRVDWGGLELAPFEMSQQEGQFDLSLLLVDGSESIGGFVNYNADLFDASTMQRMVSHLQTLLEAIVTDADQGIDTLPLLIDAERQQLLVGLNDATARYPQEKCIHQLFEAQAAREPAAVAVMYEDQRLTYGELDARSNQLAHHLRNLGVGPEVLVGICVERSLEMVIGIMGILKAGGAYVPLDPDYPPQRLAFMLQDSQMPVLLTQQSLLGCLPEHEAQVICLDTDWPDVARQPENAPTCLSTPESLAYVIYTSGSTGAPKGSLISHANVVRLMAATEEWFAFDSSDVWTLFHSFAFDFSVWELWGALLYGGKLVVVPYWVSRSPCDFRDLLQRHQVTVLNQTPSAFYQLMAADAVASPENRLALKWIIFGGEALNVERLRDWFDRYGDRSPQLVNMYGITETTVHVTYRPLCKADLAGPIASPIGVPIRDLQLYVLDQHQNVVPIGVPGELHVGGAGLARGYLNRPELTAERFFRNPFSDDPGSRLYKTGDLCRWLADGDMEYLGRIDQQVKIRGFRIELGEIEAALLAHPQVQESAVLAIEDEPEAKRLVGYVVLAAGGNGQPDSLSVNQLRDHLKLRLPEYMVPSAFVFLESLPLTPNGKLDRKALPAPEGRGELEQQYLPPRNPIEEQLCAIWQQVLRVERVGIADNFFELGGHSLLATQVISRVRGAFQVELPIAAMFSRPSVAELANTVRTQLQAGQGVQTPPLVAQPRTAELPLSFAQQRLWFLDQLLPGSPLYNVPYAMRLRGPLDRQALQQAFAELVRRHEALRTRFESVQGKPRQVIEPDWPGERLEYEDLRTLPHEQRETEMIRRAQAMASRPFDLSQGPLLRVHLWQLADDEHLLQVSIHHIVSDGWSMDVLRRELSVLYQAYSQGQSSPLAALRVQYVDYALWQRSWLQGEVLEQQLKYWQERLAGAAILELPTDHPRPATSLGHGDTVRFDLSKELTERMTQLSAQQEVSMFMLLLSAWQVLLSRYSGQDDIVVGAPIANRTHAETEGLIGFFVNTLALRTDLSGDPSFVDLLHQVRGHTLAAYSHQDLPFEQLVDALELQRDLSRESLVQVMLTWQHAPEAILDLSELTQEPIEFESNTAKFDVAIAISETEGGLACALEYRTDLFQRETMERMAGHFTTLLEGILSEPDCRLSQLPLLNDAERQQLLVDWIDAESDYPKGKCFHELFEAQVERTPVTVAVADVKGPLSYQHLNERANRLAAYLQQLGVGADSAVGVCLERSPETLISLLAILKAGGAYLPLEPGLPTERMRFMLDQAAAQVVLTNSASSANLPPGPARVVDLDSASEAIAGHSKSNPPSLATPHNLAYIIYTSGSTGLPKGAMVTHQGMLNHLYAKVRDLELTADDRLAQTAPQSFDISIWQFLNALLVGGSVQIVDIDTVRTPSQLLKLVEQQHVSILEVVPSLFRAMLDELTCQGNDRPRFAHLRWLLLTGEALPPRLCREWFQLYPAIPLLNAYGPTECSDDVTHHALDGPLPEDATSVPIGRAVANTQLYILDAQLQPTPLGVAGELYVGGDGVGRGYVSDTSRTAEAFVPSPFGTEPGARLYKTGDLCRWLPDGNMEFLGRIDHQVKIRGNRIELGEIESALTAHAQVQDAVVLAREEEPGEKRLVGYVVSVAGDVASAGDNGHSLSLSVNQLREHLKQSLPEYMVPSAFVFLDSLPLTPNGKLDRQALPAPEAIESEQRYVPPRTPVQEQLCDIWQLVLSVERVGIEDNFFELGGHSLLATQVVSRVRSAFQVELPVAELFSRPTVAGLAESVQTKLQGGQGIQRPPLVAQPHEDALPLSFAQQRLWFFDQLLPDSPLFNMPGAMRLRGLLDRPALERAFTEIVRRHEALRTRFESVQGEARQVIEAEWPAWQVDYEDLRSLPEEQREAEAICRAQSDVSRPFNLRQGPLLRVCLWQLADDEHLLLVNMHHIVSDGWSLGVLTRELRVLYQAYSQGHGSPLAKLKVQYADFALWQRSWLQDEVLDEQLDYWQQRLAGAAILDLPTDHRRPPISQGQGAMVRFELPQELAGQLKHLSRQQEVSMFMLLMSAWQVLLARYSGQDDIVVGAPIANRTQPETEGLIGFFVNTLALRSDLSGDPCFVDLLDQVRERSLEAYAHQDLPFERLVDALGLERDLSRESLVQVAFAWQPAAATRMELHQLAVEPVALELTAAKTDLILFVEENERGLAGAMEYRTDLFERGTIERMAKQLTTLLEGIVSAPQRRLSQFSLLSEREGFYPVSHGQQAMWYTQQLAPDSAAFNDALTLHVRAALDVSALRRACQTLALRHPVLRTVYPIMNGEPAQSIQQASEVPIEIIEAQAWTWDETRRQVTAAYRRPFDLEHGPVWRVSVFRRAPDDHVLLLTIHEIACDAWSCGIVLRELDQLYAAESQGLPAPALPTAAAYTDYTLWQRDMLASDKGERQRTYWHTRLAAALEESPGLDLPTDRPLPSMQSRRGASHSFHLGADLLAQLESLSEAQGVTLFVTLLAAYHVLLARYTGQTQIPIAVPMNGRSRRDYHNTLGNIMNTAVIHADTSGQPSFQEFLTQVQRALKGGLLHQEYPFELLLRQFQPQKDTGYAPLGRVFFNMPLSQRFAEYAPLFLPESSTEQIRWGGLPVEPFYIPQQEGQFPLGFDLWRTDDALLCVVKYNADAFDPQTIERMGEHYQTLLRGIAAQPEQPISRLPLLSEAQCQRVLVEWNGSASDYPQDLCMHEVFEAQVARAPEAVAVLAGQQSLSYQALNARANQLAGYLQEQGVGSETVVGVCLERSPETLISLLAIFKAGGSYLPLEPALPPERMRFMLEQAAVQVVLTTAACAANLPAEPARLVDLDASREAIADHAASNPPPLATPHNLAYIIYTSGSTGLPKGAMVTHRGMLNHLYAKVRDLDLTARDRLAQTAPQSFDISIWQFLNALLVGGSVQIVDSDTVRTPPQLLDLVARQGISILEVVPSLFRALLDELAAQGTNRPQFAELRWVLLTGEALPPSQCNDWFALYPSIPLLNAYGPTECSDDVTHHALDGPLPEDATSVPIGRAVANTQLYILDAQLQPTPPGVAGELYVGGDGVGRGYVSNASRTAAAFVPSPFAAQAGSRLYKTGDLARYMPDGTIEFLGRIDHQVKIRGHRIELGEIESALSAHPQVHESVVLARDEEHGEKRLVAYIVAIPFAGNNGHPNPLSVGDLRDHLSQSLPDYMLPSAFVFLDELPLTPNGKLDRQALPAPDAIQSEQQYVPPRNAVEEQLCAIWQKILRVDRVGIEDNFFELGGDSILSIQVNSRASEHGILVTVRQLFEHQTIAGLALVAETAGEVQATQGLVRGEAPLTPIQRLFFERELQVPNHFNQALLLLMKRPVATETLQRAIEHLLEHHDVLRLRFERDSANTWRQRHADLEDNSIVQRVDLSAEESGNVPAAIEQHAAEAQASLNLATGPLLRVLLFDLGPTRPARLLIVIHHLVVDGVSWRILLPDLERLLKQVEAGQPLRLPPKTTSFQEWAERLQDYANGEELSAELDYWRQISQQPMADFPIDYPTGNNTADLAEILSVELSADQTEALLRQVPQAYQTQINDVLLTALLQAYTPWSGNARLRLDLEGHGREELFPEVDLSRTVGWFTTLYPVLIESPQPHSAEVSLKAVKEQLRAVPRRGIGYGVLRYLRDDPSAAELRQAGYLPLSFNYLGQFDTAASPDSLLQGFADESPGPAHSPGVDRPHLIDVNCVVSGGRLRIDWTYGRELYERSTIESLAAAFTRALTELIDHCLDPQSGGYTPSDFPLCGLSQHELDQLLTAEQARQKSIEDIYPLSGMQQGMLYHTLREPESGIYFEQLVLRLEGPLEVDVFQRAWRQLQQRHAVLRTTFAWQGVPELLQIVHRQQDLPWTYCDWRDRSPSRQEQDLEQELASARSDGLDLEYGPLWRVELKQLDETSSVCVLSSHHALSDGWSLPLLLQEVLKIYHASRAGQSLSLPKPRPYRDYIAWLARQDTEAAKSFWLEQLSGFTAATPLGVDRVCPDAEPGHDTFDVQLSSDSRSKLQQFGRQYRVTLNTLVQGAWALLLSRYSGEEDVLFGATTSGRPAELAGVDEMVGLFINTLPVRVHVPAAEPVANWIEQLQNRQSASRQFEHSSLVDIQQWSDVPAGSPMFESLLVFENFPVDEELRTPQKEGLQLRRVEGHEQTNYPLTVAVAPGEELHFAISYDRTRFDRAAILRMASHLTTLLEGMVSRPDCPLSELPMLTDSERRQLLVEWNDTTAQYPQTKCIHQLFEAQVARTPAAVAVVFGDQRLTYAELNARSNQLAHHLRDLGVGPDVLVGISVARSPEMVVGILGILKAGGAYVPLDPDYPVQRLAFMLQDTQAPVLLTQQSLIDGLPEHEAQVICLDGDWPDIAGRSQTNPPSRCTPENLAYVIYTSGSTGKPKGVMIAHRALCNHMNWMGEALPLSEQDNVLQKTPFSFDASVWEFFAPLLAGARLTMARPDGHGDPAYLVSTIREERISVFQAVPTLLRAVCRAPGFSSCESLVRIFSGGEQLGVSDQETLFGELADVELHNLYGPTEACIEAVVWKCRRGDARATVPIGRPIDNTQVYVLDRHRNPVPIGVPGELCIGGAGLARGYLNRPELTAEKFIRNPFNEDPDSRLYKTGDLCCWLADGNLDFLGRIDHQVKIRGYRIELGEIESALLAHPQVQAAVVLARDDDPGNPRLVGYVVAIAGENGQPNALSDGQLREHLKQSLPDYMVPAAFVFLNSLPLTPNGKLDRRALSAPEASAALEQRYVPPRTPMQEQLCDIWQQVLGVERVGIEDSFFELGGHSLLAMQVVSRVRDAFQVELALRTIFEITTIAGLATHVEELNTARNLQTRTPSTATKREVGTL